MTKNRNLKLYFPNLNGLRFIAAFFVIINHVEQLKVFYKIGNLQVSTFAGNIGKLGVMLFFVLSGFLITYLLLLEEQKFDKIHIKKFYVRRFLRIVPLYLLLILVVFFVIQKFSFWEIPQMKNPIENNFSIILLLHLFFIPNLATAIYGFIPYIAQAWSIGTEEQSYLIWPILLKKFKNNRLILMMSIIGFYIIIKIILLKQLALPIPYREILSKFWTHFNIDSIAIGSVFAILLFKKHHFLKYVLNNKVFYSVAIITILFLAFAVRVPFFQYLMYSILFGILIINLAANKKLSNVLEWKTLNYLGRISYGIYMYHFIVLIAVLIVASKYKIETNWIIYPLVLIGTITISSLSYHYFETPFLKLKSKFSFIKSGKI